MTSCFPDFPSTENHPRALGATGLISLVLHGLLFGALAAALPKETCKVPEEKGISIDLETIETPDIPPTVTSEDEAIPTQAPETPTPEAAPIAKRQEPVKPKPKPAPKTAAVTKDSAKPAGNASGNQESPSQAASRKTVGQASPPAPAGDSHTPKPAYPELARKRGQEGTVNVRCQVDASGVVTDIALAKSSGYKLLDEAALKTVKKWKFKPGKKNGESVAGTVVVPVQFRLE